MLMSTASFDKEALNITVRNLYPSLELVSPVYFSTSITYCVPPSQQADDEDIVEASFGIDYKQKYFKGALLYKLQRKYTTKTVNQSNSSITSIEDIATNIYLLVLWNVENRDYGFCVCLIELNSDFIWDEDKLWALYYKYWHQFYKNYMSNITTWLMHGDTVVTTRYDVTYGSDYKLDIVISEEAGKYDMEEPMKIDPKRSVLSLLLLIVLIYAISFSIPLVVKLDIHNQCSNVDLVSPTYATVNKFGCHRTPGHKVYAGDTMRSAFMIMPNNKSYGALIYKLQRKQLHESVEISEDTSSTVHLLVVWKFNTFEELYADVLLVEHDKGFDWDKDDLTDLYHKNSNRFRLFSYSTTETWSLDDNIALMTTFDIMNEDHILDITISEMKRCSGERAPAHIDLKR
jgi:hypothetical protein